MKKTNNEKRFNGFGGLGFIKSTLPKGEPIKQPEVKKTPATPAPAKEEKKDIVRVPVTQTKVDYESVLNADADKDYEGPLHNPNPYDFVFFADTDSKPNLFKRDKLDNDKSKLLSGYLEVELKALTPVHIVGTQNATESSRREGKKQVKQIEITKSSFYREETPCIPGSSIRGMLRSFIEALTNGWVSQAQKEYEIGKKRHFPFNSFEEKSKEHGCLNMNNYIVGQAIPSAFEPVFLSDETDIATYLFGYVENKKGKSGATVGKVMVEDAEIDSPNLKEFEMIDTKAESMMGGPEPRANWWHMRPSKEVLQRNVSANDGDKKVAQFMGEGFWGRKFYYHQKPDKCIAEYYPVKYNPNANGNTWPNLYKYKIQCLDVEKTALFRIYIDRVPEDLLALLCVSLFLPGNMRHKLGYAKAFGYGSVEFSLTCAQLREEKNADWPNPFSDQKSKLEAFITQGWKCPQATKFIDQNSLNCLARILHYDKDCDITFTYPPYNKLNFKKVVQWGEYEKASIAKTATDIETAKKLWDTKRPLHFMLYQARAENFKDKIMKRKP